MNGDLTVTLIADDTDPLTYTLANNEDISATVKVSDNDASIPTLSIVSPTNPQAETANFVEFAVIADVNPGRPLSVRYTPTNIDFDNFLATTSGEAIITEPAIEFSDDGGSIFTGTIRVAIDDDSVSESTGMISVTLNDDTADPITYNVATGNQVSATATILDNDAPEITIAGGEPVSESVSTGQAVFTVSSKVQPISPITVYFIPESSMISQQFRST